MSLNILETSFIGRKMAENPKVVEALLATLCGRNEITTEEAQGIREIAENDGPNIALGFIAAICKPDSDIPGHSEK